MVIFFFNLSLYFGSNSSLIRFIFVCIVLVYNNDLNFV